MKHSNCALAVLATAGALALGCSTPTDDAGANAESAVTTARPSPIATVHTDRGNDLSVDFVVDPPTGAGFASPSLVIDYHDGAHAFGGANAIDASIVIHKSDGSHVRGSVALSRSNDGRYDGVFGVGDTLVASIEVALSHGGERDPAGTKTYRVGFDHADARCAVVLRTVTAPDFGELPASGSYVWTGTIDVAKNELEGSALGIQWRSSFGDTASSELVTKKIAGAPTGFQRFAFALAKDTLPANGQDATALRMFQLAVIPFLNLPDGTRIFDHNRVSDGTSYVLWSGDTAGGLVPAPPSPQIGKGFSVHDDASICPHAR